MLAIPRPRTRAECLQEARPCPWVGCRHHLLLEVAKATRRAQRALRAPGTDPARAPGLVVNLGRAKGRRRHLSSSCDADTLEVWIDDALERLAALPYSCSLDLAEWGANLKETAQMLGISKTQAKAETHRALRRWAQAFVGAQGEMPSIKVVMRILRRVLDG